MATNVYRAERRIYFGGSPCIEQGYHMSTTSCSVDAFSDENTWEEVESRVSKLFPNADRVRVAGFAMISSVDDFSEEASTNLECELREAGYDIGDQSIFDIIDQIVSDERPDYGVTCDCGKPGVIGCCPFDQDVHGKETECNCCDECAKQCSQDI